MYKMKKIAVITLAALAFGLAGCDMDKEPYDSIPGNKGLETIVDFENFRVGIYSCYRAMTGGGYILAPEIQADAFNAVADFSNTYGEFYSWSFVSTNSTVSSVWHNYYVAILQANYMLMEAKRAMEDTSGDLTDVQKQQIRVYEGEAYFTRAYSYFCLANFFCKDYNAQTAESDLGIPLQLSYDPNMTVDKYPARSSLMATYRQILNDLDDAAELIETGRAGIVDYDRNVNNRYVTVSTAPKNRGNYITTDVVTALRARVALQMDDYQKAAEYAQELIDSGTYPLMGEVNALKDMWKNDTGTETIWQIAMTTPDEAGSANGYYFIGDPPTKKDYIPTADLMSMFEDNDMRKSVYFGKYNLVVSSGSAGDIYFFNKYPGNDYYNGLGSSTKFVNQPKPFRIAEMYLIAAEAYAQIGTAASVKKGSDLLKELRTKRIQGYTQGDYTDASVLMDEVQDERVREMVGEGFRLMDLKRWGKGVKRNSAQNSGLIWFPGVSYSEKLDREANDPRMVWPIPKSEMDANPQLRGYQNPGY